MAQKIVKIITTNSPSLKKRFKAALAVTEGITPFLEKPCSTKFESSACKSLSDNNRACDLFSIFTADIIREETLFIR